jgi:hypothetical protein
MDFFSKMKTQLFGPSKPGKWHCGGYAVDVDPVCDAARIGRPANETDNYVRNREIRRRGEHLQRTIASFQLIEERG